MRTCAQIILDQSASPSGSSDSNVWPVPLLNFVLLMFFPTLLLRHETTHGTHLRFNTWQDSFTCDTCVPDEPFSSRASVNDQTALGASLGVSLGAAIGIGLGVGLGISAGLGAYIAAGFVQLSVINAEEIRRQNGVAGLLEIHATIKSMIKPGCMYHLWRIYRIGKQKYMYIENINSPINE